MSAKRRVSARLLACWLTMSMAAGAVVLVESKAQPDPSPALSIGGPYARLLAASTDLGPSRRAHTQLTVALHDSTQPKSLVQWARKQGLAVRWQPGQDWAIVEGTAP